MFHWTGYDERCWQVYTGCPKEVSLGIKTRKKFDIDPLQIMLLKKAKICYPIFSKRIFVLISISSFRNISMLCFSHFV